MSTDSSPAHLQVMTHFADHNRTPAGVPTGGQFTTSARDEVSVSLAKPMTLAEAAEAALADLDPDKGTWPTSDEVDAIIEVVRVTDVDEPTPEVALRCEPPLRSLGHGEVMPSQEQVEAVIDAVRALPDSAWVEPGC